MVGWKPHERLTLRFSEKSPHEGTGQSLVHFMVNIGYGRVIVL